jgi:hypothetical protein
MPMRPYKRTPARKKNIRNVHKVHKRKSQHIDSWIIPVYETGKQEYHEFWDKDWELYGCDMPENVVKVKKPSHLRFLPKDTIVFVGEGHGDTFFQEKRIVSPIPTSLNHKGYVTKNPNWKEWDRPNDLKSWLNNHSFDFYWHNIRPREIEFPFGYVIFEKPSFERYVPAGFIGKYMFGHGPDFRFHWSTCFVASDGLLPIVQGLKYGKSIYRKEIKKLRLKV